MPDRRFFQHTGPVSLADLAERAGFAVSDARPGDLMIETASPLSKAGREAISYLSDRRYLEDLKQTGAGAVFVGEKLAEHAPAGAVVILSAEPQAAWSRVAAVLHPVIGLSNTGFVHPDARLEDDVYLAPGVVVGQGARIGSGTRIGANTVIGPGVSIGRQCVIAANVTIEFALVGDRVQLAANAVIGSAGFGVAAGAGGLVDIPQLGRVILQDGVSVGAGTTIDRGAWDDTVIGENTKLDNQVQIGHNVVMGRNCVMAAHCGISGSVTFGDNVQCGGAVGIKDHVRIGNNVQLAARSGVMRDIEDGEIVGGSPAQPIKDWMREIAWVRNQIAAERDAKARQKDR
ncbi:MAG: UDP-3-O-(3-hydroxymyristoyl)glucosamine N-acyltransferase [Caulobacteraceae bacterium]|nr:UDP-3-O-(3-hydroxymyristoyl)glucosamine N-acyltransferase [Caulobacteraceae bacterium]